MSEGEVRATIKTSAVLDAFEKTKIAKLPAEVRKAYEAQDREFDRYRTHTKTQVDRGKEEGREEGRGEEKLMIARKLHATGTSLGDIAEITGLSMEALGAFDR